jgi:hypothetical protein
VTLGDDPRSLPGGTGLTSIPANVTRGIGFAVGFKNLAFAEAFDDYAEARVTLTPLGLAVETAAAEVGQGMITVLQQIARTATGIGQVDVEFVDTSRIGSAGSTSASRQTQVTGGAVLEASQKVREQALLRVGGDDLSDEGVLRDGDVIARSPARPARAISTQDSPWRPTGQSSTSTPSWVWCGWSTSTRRRMSARCCTRNRFSANSKAGRFKASVWRSWRN